MRFQRNTDCSTVNEKARMYDYVLFVSVLLESIYIYISFRLHSVLKGQLIFSTLTDFCLSITRKSLCFHLTKYCLHRGFKDGPAMGIELG